MTSPFLSYRNLTIRRMSRVWHQPSRVNRTYGCSKLEHGTSVPLCCCGNDLMGIWNPTKIDFQSPMQPCLVSAVPAHTLCNYSSDILSPPLSLQGGFTLLRRATVRGPTVRQLSHTVFFSFATRFFINLCINKHGYFKQSYIKKTYDFFCKNLTSSFS